MNILSSQWSWSCSQWGRGLRCYSRAGGARSCGGWGVRPQMPLQVGSHNKATATNGAGKRALGRMSALVQQQVGGVCEGLGAEWATEGALARVHPLVLPQIGALSKALPTNATGVRAFSCVHMPVAPQAGGVLEGLGAVRARVGPLTGMLSQVVLVMG